jgi:hypothetical protein
MVHQLIVVKVMASNARPALVELLDAGTKE